MIIWKHDYWDEIDRLDVRCDCVVLMCYAAGFCIIVDRFEMRCDDTSDGMRWQKTLGVVIEVLSHWFWYGGTRGYFHWLYFTHIMICLETLGVVIELLSHWFWLEGTRGYSPIDVDLRVHGGTLIPLLYLTRISNHVWWMFVLLWDDCLRYYYNILYFHTLYCI